MRPKEIFSLHSHQTIIRKSIYALYFYGRPSEKTCEARLLALFLKLIIIIFCFIWGEAVGDFLPHSHQTIIRKSIYTLYFYGRPSEKDREAGLLAPGYKNKSIHALYFYGRLYEKDYVVVLLVLFFCPTYLQNLMIMLVPYFIIPNSYNLTGFRF